MHWCIVNIRTQTLFSETMRPRRVKMKVKARVNMQVTICGWVGLSREEMCLYRRAMCISLHSPHNLIWFTWYTAPVVLFCDQVIWYCTHHTHCCQSITPQIWPTNSTLPRSKTPQMGDDKREWLFAKTLISVRETVAQVEQLLEALEINRLVGYN